MVHAQPVVRSWHAATCAVEEACNTHHKPRLLCKFPVFVCGQQGPCYDGGNL